MSGRGRDSKKLNRVKVFYDVCKVLVLAVVAGKWWPCLPVVHKGMWWDSIGKKVFTGSNSFAWTEQ
jgi:hypothetical protein